MKQVFWQAQWRCLVYPSWADLWDHNLDDSNGQGVDNFVASSFMCWLHRHASKSELPWNCFLEQPHKASPLGLSFSQCRNWFWEGDPEWECQQNKFSKRPTEKVYGFLKPSIWSPTASLLLFSIGQSRPRFKGMLSQKLEWGGGAGWIGLRCYISESMMIPVYWP